MNREISGSSISLKKLDSSNVSPNYLEWLSRKEVNQFLETRFNLPTTKDQLLDFIKISNENPNVFLYGIFKNEIHIGNIKLEKNQYHHRGDIGLIIGESSFWGQGIASEAIKLITDWGFDILLLHKITAGAYSSNKGSIKAFLSNGFAVEAVLKEHCVFNDSREDVVLLGKIRG